MDKLVHLQEQLAELFQKFFSVKEKMNEIVHNQKKSYKHGAIYVDFEYCKKKKAGCIYCPHWYEWRLAFVHENKHTGSKRRTWKRLGRRITHKILRKYGKDNLYPLFKEIDSELALLQKERNLLANKILRIEMNLKKF